eukprot:418431_1
MLLPIIAFIYLVDGTCVFNMDRDPYSGNPHVLDLRQFQNQTIKCETVNSQKIQYEICKNTTSSSSTYTMIYVAGETCGKWQDGSDEPEIQYDATTYTWRFHGDGQCDYATNGINIHWLCDQLVPQYLVTSCDTCTTCTSYYIHIDISSKWACLGMKYTAPSPTEAPSPTVNPKTILDKQDKIIELQTGMIIIGVIIIFILFIFMIIAIYQCLRKWNRNNAKDVSDNFVQMITDDKKQQQIQIHSDE